MKLSPKITVLLMISFFVLSLAFVLTSLTALGRNQSDNISLFKNEFVETNLESFQNSSDLFFGYLDNEINTGKISSQDEAVAFARKIDPRIENVILVNFLQKNFIDGANPKLTSFVDAKTLDGFVSKWTLDAGQNDFSVDNLDKFSAGDTSVTPVCIRVKLYDKLGLIIGYGKVFDTGKVRVQFVQQQNSLFYRNYLVILITIFLLAIILIPLFSILFMKKAVVDPIKRLNMITQRITEGDLDKRVEVTSSDEIGELSASFNKMTKKLSNSKDAVNAKITELAGEHGKLASLVESIKLGVVMVDLSLNVILSNTAAREVFGKTTTKSLTFKDLSEKIKGKVNISQALSTYVRAGKPLNIQEVMIDSTYYRLFMSPVRDITQKIFIGAVFVMEDVSEQKKLDRMRSEIVSITSHQLRTPATIIKGNLDMVLGGDVGKIAPKQRELLQDTYMGNERMIHLVNDLMDVSKIDEGNFVLLTEPVDLENLVEEVVKEVSPFAVEKHVGLTFVRGSEALPKVKINSQKVKQVIQNLIDNAIKYSASRQNGQVKVDVVADGKFLKFSVRDNGIGIPAADQSRIFVRFYRGSNSTQLDPGGGSGLGLYIAKGVVEQGGGKIWFDSKEGEGTAFYATFPIK